MTTLIDFAGRVQPVQAIRGDGQTANRSPKRKLRLSYPTRSSRFGFYGVHRPLVRRTAPTLEVKSLRRRLSPSLAGSFLLRVKSVRLAWQ